MMVEEIGVWIRCFQTLLPHHYRLCAKYSSPKTNILESRHLGFPKHLFYVCELLLPGSGTKQIEDELKAKLCIRAHICHKYHKLYLWRKKLSCGEIWSFYKEFEQFMEFYQSLCRFCSKSMWRKICVEKICVEKKWQIWGLTSSSSEHWYS